jgi:aldehyde dehydrogenase (NAD+)
MLVPASRLAEVEALAKQVAEKVTVGDPASQETEIGPVVSRIQFERVEDYISKGIAEGAKLLIGGEGRPNGLTKGYYVRPTIFSNVNNNMLIAREEIFGPVLAILPYRDEAEAVRIANDTPYGLQAYVWSANLGRANQIGRQIRAGRVTINGAAGDMNTPFGGFKRSGNGREWGEHGLKDFLEVKAVLGAEVA